jgi:hypothetical protein
MTLMLWLVALHVCCTTLGLGGLVCANVLLALTAGGADAPSLTRMAGVSLLGNRIFGGLLGAGVLLGLATMGAEHVPANATWLVLTYALIVLGIAFQAAVAVPWQLRIVRSAETVTAPARTARLIAAAFLLQFVLIVFVMVVKPYAG